MKTPTMLFALLTATAGCLSPSPILYVRKGQALADGRPFEASYSVPRISSSSTVRVRVLGGERLPLRPGAFESFVRVQLVADNVDDDVRWTLDPNEQLLVLGDAALAPEYAKNSGPSRVLRVERGGRGSMDLYYRVPREHPAGVRVDWHLRRARAEVAAAQTEFERLDARPAREVSPSGLALYDEREWVLHHGAAAFGLDYDRHVYGCGHGCSGSYGPGGISGSGYGASCPSGYATTAVTTSTAPPPAPAEPSPPSTAPGAFIMSTWSGGGQR